ncbi:MFS transporter [Natrialbaceae archaeon AArc-T1-2]|uniref:MFS transporter n=1 Tax=Natrialbaceae archaeon AArc-T1-2 TaxID=3053904 RepID=UPI00255ADB59|nr:MFS transporter [Natrialbaceae archaeon AArc-T1-2]WIV66752.1 MFS transporter [Natrialbaceae archaeon AArc-T1-2]
MAETVLPTASRRSQLFGSLCLLVFLVNLGRVIYAPLLEPFRTTFDASAAEVGLLATLAWVGSASLRFPTGYLLTRYPRHRVVLLTGLVLAGASLFAAAAGTLSMLYVGAFLMGIASGMYFVAASPLVSELFPTRVGRAIGIHGTSSQVAAVTAPLLVGAYFAVPWPIAAWRVVFLSISAAALFATIALFVAAKRATLPEAGAADRRLLVAFRRQWPIVVTGVAIVGFTGLVWNGVFNFYVTYLVETKGFSERRARTALTVLFAAGVPAFALAGVVADRVRFVPLILALAGGFVASLFAVTYVEGVFAIFAVTAITGLLVHGLFPAVDTYLLASLPDENRASAYALFSGTMMPIQATGSVILGTLVDFGVAFDAAIRLFAASIAALLAVALVLYAAGRIPTGAND